MVPLILREATVPAPFPFFFCYDCSKAKGSEQGSRFPLRKIRERQRAPWHPVFRMSYHGFILSNSQKTSGRSTQLVLQGRLSDGGRFLWTVTRPGIVFFVDRDRPKTPSSALRKKVELRNLRGVPVDALYFRTTPDLAQALSVNRCGSIPRTCRRTCAQRGCWIILKVGSCAMS